jgi:type IV secretory pathway TrbD component
MTAETKLDSEAFCIANISPVERRKRLVGGIIQLGITLAILAVLVATGVDRWWRLPLGLLFWASASGFFQWRDKT